MKNNDQWTCIVWLLRRSSRKNSIRLTEHKTLNLVLSTSRRTFSDCYHRRSREFTSKVTCQYYWILHRSRWCTMQHHRPMTAFTEYNQMMFHTDVWRWQFENLDKRISASLNRNRSVWPKKKVKSVLLDTRPMIVLNWDELVAYFSSRDLSQA